MGSEYPSPETTLVILLGASEFPRAPLFTSSPAFRNSAAQLREYFLDKEGFDLPRENLLNLFDVDKPRTDLNEEIVNFLDARLTMMKAQDRPASDLLVYYVGHGGFSPGDNEYFLAIRDTRGKDELYSSIPIKSLALALKEHARYLRRYLILDSCFAAAAYEAFQSPPPEVACAKTLDEFPQKGTALLCASGPRDPAKILPSQQYTMFSDALVHVLRHGSPEDPEKLSFATVAELTRAQIKERNLTDAVRPQIHSPDQKEGDVASLPLFPNPARRQEEIKAALTRVEDTLGKLSRRQEEQETRQQQLTNTLANLERALEKVGQTMTEQPKAPLADTLFGLSNEQWEALPSTAKNLIFGYARRRLCGRIWLIVCLLICASATALYVGKQIGKQSASYFFRDYEYLFTVVADITLYLSLILAIISISLVPIVRRQIFILSEQPKAMGGPAHWLNYDIIIKAQRQRWVSILGIEMNIEAFTAATIIYLIFALIALTILLSRYWFRY